MFIFDDDYIVDQSRKEGEKDLNFQSPKLWVK